MKLKKILDGVDVIYADDLKNIDIKKICISTKDVEEGSLFVALKGQRFNGHDFLDEAKAKGATAFVVEEFADDFDGTQILVKNTRKVLSIVSKNFYKPKNKLKVIGITGTNGKTTTTFMLKSILDSAGKNVGVIGTEGVYYNGKMANLNMTTPDPIDLFKYLKIMSDENVEYVVMEVSAHAIYLNKIAALKFSAKALTNITEDHLDFFETMSAYAKTKIEFMKDGNCIRVVNNDDEVGLNLSRSDKKIYSFGIDENADVFAYDISRDCSRYAVNLFEKNLDISTSVLGKYNVENALCAITLAKLLGIKDKHIKMGIDNFQSVAGRMNIYQNGGKRAIIDFAHTPDALQKLFTTIRPFTKGKLIAVFGCGGNRDPQKRSVMGEIACKLCDMVYVTNDNPRNEKPQDIASQIVATVDGGYEIILDRKKAIETATSNMQDGDILVLCGKGAEDYMEIGSIKYPYSDRAEIEKWGFKIQKNNSQQTENEK